MTEVEIDRLLGGTPCLCGTTDTWHFACYKGKTPAQATAASKRVYRKIRAKLKAERIEALAKVIDKAMCGPSSTSNAARDNGHSGDNSK